MLNDAIMTSLSVLTGLLVFAPAVGMVVRADETKVPITFSGGHDTDPKDGGRPVVLIAAALGVKPEVFRKAFSGVTPARDGRPSPADARRNKAVLMKALEPHGVTNDRLDEVSDYYRYQPQRGKLWKNTPAKAYAVVENGKIQSVVVTNHGSGYSSPPTATVRGMEQIPFKVTISFDKDFDKNGAIGSVEIATAAPK
jgi:hypothetical protein